MWPEIQGIVAVPQGSLDKRPWKDLPPQQGVVEEQFIFQAYLGESIAPFRVLDTVNAVIPFDHNRLMSGDDLALDRYPGLATWWRQAEAVWSANRTSEKRTLLDQLDYMHQLTSQRHAHVWRVVYTKAGANLAAAVVKDPVGVIDHLLYWTDVDTRGEALYLVGVLNAPTITDLVRPFQAEGGFGPRHFDKYVWLAPIPIYNPDDDRHKMIVKLAMQAEDVAQSVDLPSGMRFQAARSIIRNELKQCGLMDKLNDAVSGLILPR